jgi:hypothetical protein
MPETPTVHYLPPREDGKDAGSADGFTRDPALVTCPLCLARLAETREA